jgi:hypothetical protein
MLWMWGLKSEKAPSPTVSTSLGGAPRPKISDYWVPWGAYIICQRMATWRTIMVSTFNSIISSDRTSLIGLDNSIAMEVLQWGVLVEVFFWTGKARKGREAALIPGGYIPNYKNEIIELSCEKAQRAQKKPGKTQSRPWSPLKQKLGRRPSSTPPGNLPLGVRTTPCAADELKKGLQ